MTDKKRDKKKDSRPCSMPNMMNESHYYLINLIIKHFKDKSTVFIKKYNCFIIILIKFLKRNYHNKTNTQMKPIKEKPKKKGD
jgi:hypothetical protein